MTEPAGFEFITDDDSAAGAETEVVALGRRLPSWLIPVLCLALVGGLVVRVVADSRSHPASQPVAFTLSSVPVGTVGAPVEDEAVGDAIDVTVDANSVYVMRPGVIDVLDARSGAQIADIPLTGVYAVRSAYVHLVIDSVSKRLWAIEQAVSPAHIVEIDLRSLQPRRQLREQWPVLDATTLDAHLYLATTFGLLDLAPSTLTPIAVTGSVGSIGSVSADPARNRVITVTSPTPATTVSAVSDDRVVAQRNFGALIVASLAIVGDEIWIGGFDGAGGVLSRLDPGTLQPQRLSVTAREIGGALVTAGQRSLWLSNGGVGLWCVSTATGAPVASWPTSAPPVSSSVDATYVIDRGLVKSLSLPRACLG